TDRGVPPQQITPIIPAARNVSYQARAEAPITHLDHRSYRDTMRVECRPSSGVVSTSWMTRIAGNWPTIEIGQAGASIRINARNPDIRTGSSGWPDLLRRECCIRACT